MKLILYQKILLLNMIPRSLTKCPSNQLVTINNIQNLGELNGSCTFELKYRVIKDVPPRIHQVTFEYFV